MTQLNDEQAFALLDELILKRNLLVDGRITWGIDTEGELLEFPGVITDIGLNPNSNIPSVVIKTSKGEYIRSIVRNGVYGEANELKHRPE